MEQVKEKFRTVRCIDPKTNTVKYIPAHAVAECVKTYGLVVQDHEVKDVVGKDLKETTSLPPGPYEGKYDRPVVEGIEELNTFENEQTEDLRTKYERIFGKKAGNKKEETILKEIEDFENQNI